MSAPLPGLGKLILVVDDEYLIRETLRDALEADGYDVVTAQNGKEGLGRLGESLRPNLILLDMMMPIMGGQEFLQGLAQRPDLAPIPVLVVSATADTKNTPGAKAILKKPPDLDQLLWMVFKYTQKDQYSPS